MPVPSMYSELFDTRTAWPLRSSVLPGPMFSEVAEVVQAPPADRLNHVCVHGVGRRATGLHMGLAIFRDDW